MMKIMEEIFTGTMKRFMGSGEPVSNIDSTGNEGRTHTTRSLDTTGTRHHLTSPKARTIYLSRNAILPLLNISLSLLSP